MQYDLDYDHEGESRLRWCIHTEDDSLASLSIIVDPVKSDCVSCDGSF